MHIDNLLFDPLLPPQWVIRDDTLCPELRTPFATDLTRNTITFQLLTVAQDACSLLGNPRPLRRRLVCIGLWVFHVDNHTRREQFGAIDSICKR